MTVVSPNLEMQRGPAAAAARRVSTGPMALSEYFSLPLFLLLPSIICSRPFGSHSRAKARTISS